MRLIGCINIIDTNHKSPNKRSNDEKEKQLGYWICAQKHNYKNNDQIMKNDETRKKCEEGIE